MSKYWQISSPITVHVEVTEACNERCRHCYNFSRTGHYAPKTISMADLKQTIAELIKNRVMHVIITGGEPLLALEQTLYLAQRALDAGMSVSLNSNLVGATAENMAMLKSVGIDHILTTLHSYREEVHDFIASTPGAFRKVVRGIQTAQHHGIRVTVNTILFEFNGDDIYDTGRFVHAIGVKKYLANRTIPSPSNHESLKHAYQVKPAQANRLFKDLLRLKRELGLQVGTCRTVPQCHFDAFTRFDDFLARGCAAGKKHLLLSVSGDAHACVHESKCYGNIHAIGLNQIWHNMAQWRTLEFIPKECRTCHLFDMCDGGCRMVALTHTGSMDGFDILRRGAQHLPPYRGGIRDHHLINARQNAYSVHPDFNVRSENGFYIVRTTGAQVTFIDRSQGDFLIGQHRDAKCFKLVDLGEEHLEDMAYWIKQGLLLPSTDKS